MRRLGEPRLRRTAGQLRPVHQGPKKGRKDATKMKGRR